MPTLNDLAATEADIMRLEAENERLRAALKGIAEFCSRDGSTLGAIERLVHIQNTAHRAQKKHPTLPGRENDRLRAALERTLIGVNHIATYRTSKWPNYGTAWEAALETLGAGIEYDMWCCWNAAMCARDSLDPTSPAPRLGPAS